MSILLEVLLILISPFLLGVMWAFLYMAVITAYSFGEFGFMLTINAVENITDITDWFDYRA